MILVLLPCTYILLVENLSLAVLSRDATSLNPYLSGFFEEFDGQFGELDGLACPVTICISSYDPSNR